MGGRMPSACEDSSSGHSVRVRVGNGRRFQRMLSVFAAGVAATFVAAAPGAASAAISFGSPSVVSFADGFSGEPQVALSRKGDAVVVWSHATGGATMVEAVTHRARGGWSAPSRLSAAGGPSFSPQVAISADGDAVAVWVRSTDVGGVIEAATWS